MFPGSSWVEDEINWSIAPGKLITTRRELLVKCVYMAEKQKACCVCGDSKEVGENHLFTCKGHGCDVIVHRGKSRTYVCVCVCGRAMSCT